MSGKACILVLGMHRSGTSALTGVLSMLDVYLGSELMENNLANVKGYFENNLIYKFNDDLLSRADSSWDDLFFEEEKITNLVINNELNNLIINEFKHSDLFAIKDPRIVLLFPVYKSALEELDINIKIVIPFRNPAEVATSLRERNGFSLEKGMLLWAYHLLLAEKYSRGFDRVFIEFNELMSDTKGTLTLISEKLNINFMPKYALSKKQINEFIEPELKHHDLSLDDLSLNNSKIIREIIQLKDEFNEESIIGKLDKIREELFRYHKLFYNEDITSAFADLKITKQNLIVIEQELQKRNEELVDSRQQLNETQKDLKQRIASKIADYA